MADLNKLVLTASDYKVLLIIPNGGTFPLKTVDSFSWNNAAEEESIYVIGERDPQANKQNAVKRTGKMTMQVGELSAILMSVGLLEATQITGATLAITALVGGFQRTYSGMNINTESVDVKAKDKQSIVNLDWSALSVK